ncbi:regulatory protein RecX [Stappia sp.]|uniref:regulatory protein RecX n=1 Tax=Stappia sp. TaxID=1870903 RepID=UPI0032D8C828
MARSPKPPTEDRLTKSALSYLDRYGTTTANLRAVLQRKVWRACAALDLDPAEHEATIDAVVARCERAGLLDDARYAEARISSERRKGRSGRRIAAVLAAKGVPTDIAERQMRDDGVSEFAAACTAARKKRLGPWRTTDADHARRQKEMATLCRAGFAPSLARRIVEAETVDALEEDAD